MFYLICMNTLDSNEQIEEELEETAEEELIELRIFGEKVKIISEFLTDQKISLNKWFEGAIIRSQRGFEARITSSKIQFWLTIFFLLLIAGGLLTALLMNKIVAETFTGIIGIIIGYMFYMLKYSAIAPTKRKE